MTRFDYNHDRITRKLNKIIRKFYGTSCNCFVYYDLDESCYKTTFAETLNDKKPTHIVCESLNNLFFGNVFGTRFIKNATFEDIKMYLIQHLNYFKDRKDFLLRLTEIFINNLHMRESAAIGQTNIWQECLLTVIYTKKDTVELYLDVDTMENLLPFNHVLAKMTQSIKTQYKEETKAKYKVLELDLSSLANTIMLYS